MQNSLGVNLHFSNKDGEEYQVSLQVDDNGKLAGSEAAYLFDDGSYTLTGVSYNYFFIKSVDYVLKFDDSIKFEDYGFTISNEGYQPEETPTPIANIKSINVSKNGEFVTAGDKIDFEVKLDKVYEDIPELNLGLSVVLYDVEDSYRSITLSYNSAKDIYEGSFVVDEDMYPSEWYVNGVSTYGYVTQYDDIYSDYYINVKDANGSFANESLDVTVAFMTIDPTSGKLTKMKEYNFDDVERRTTLKELGVTAPELKEVYSGLKFEKWDYDENTQVTNSYYYFYAIYDKLPARVFYTYPDNNFKAVKDEKVVLMEHGSTYQDLIDAAKTYKPKDLYSKAVFESWITEGDYYDLDEELDYRHAAIDLATKYKDKNVVYVIQSYFDKDGYDPRSELAYVVDKNMTYNQFNEQHMKKMAKPESFEGLRFKNWEYSIHKTEQGNETLLNFSYFRAQAIYENCIVRFFIDDYFDEDMFKSSIPYGVGGTVFDRGYLDFLYAMVAEKGEKITVPTFDNYENITWVRDIPEGDNLIIKDHTIFAGYGDKKQVDENKPVELPKETVDKVVDKITASKPGETIKVDMDKATVVPKEILEEVKGKDVTIELDMGGYTWSINGKDVASSNLKDINLEVKFDTNAVPSKTVEALAQGKPTKQISLTHNGNFGFKASLKFNVGKEYSGKYGNLYYYNSDNKLVFQNAGQIDANGNVVIDFSHASDYVLVVDDVKANHDITVPNTGVTTGLNFGMISISLVGASALYLLKKNKF